MRRRLTHAGVLAALTVFAAACGGGAKPSGGASTRAGLDGVYVVDTTRDDLARHPDGMTPLIPENWGHFVYVVDGDRLAFTQEDAQACTWQYAKLSIRAKSMTWTFINGGATKSPNHAYNNPGDTFEFKWSLYRDALTLSPVPGAISPNEFFVKPWHRVSSKPARSYLSKDCPPPKAALP